MLFLNYEFYLVLFFYLFFVVILGILIYLLSYLFVQKNTDLEKLSAYECGFEPFSDSRNVFDVKFYLVAILFVIFDLEILFLLPWSVSVYALDFIGFCSMFLFLFVLGLVFVYEWIVGALDWS